MDSSGVHADNTKDYRSKLIKKYIKPQKILVKESKYHFEKMKIFFNKIDKKNNLFNRIKKKIRFIK